MSRRKLTTREKRIRRHSTIEGIDANEFLLRNADPVWLHQNEMWELLDEFDTAQQIAPADRASRAPAEQWR